jgi:putative glutamine amidotransferase
MKIALTYTGTEEKNQNYVRWLAGESSDITITVISEKKNNLNEVGSSDALLLSGGRDIHPRFYKNKTLLYPNCPQDGFDEKRDDFEIDAFSLAQKKNLPVLGICRGMQLINSVLGGSLHQDLGEGLNKVHRAGQGTDKTHPITIEKNTLLNEIVKIDMGTVNSAHHQSIDKVGGGLKVNSFSADGTIEGLEWRKRSDKPFLLLVQWHPERMFKCNLEGSPLSKNLRDRFIEEAQKSKKSK